MNEKLIDRKMFAQRNLFVNNRKIHVIMLYLFPKFFRRYLLLETKILVSGRNETFPFVFRNRVIQ